MHAVSSTSCALVLTESRAPWSSNIQGNGLSFQCFVIIVDQVPEFKLLKLDAFHWIGVFGFSPFYRLSYLVNYERVVSFSKKHSGPFLVVVFDLILCAFKCWSVTIFLQSISGYVSNK